MWEDTVMKIALVDNYGLAVGFEELSEHEMRNILHQAEISFKAGEKEMFRKLRQSLRGEPTAFDYALDGIEIQWLYEHSKPN